MVGASPLSSISYSTSATVRFPSVITPTSILSEGSGGINQFYFGAAYEVFKNFSVGGNFSYYLGTIKKVITVPPTDVTNQLIVANRTTAHNLGGDFGAQYFFMIKKTKIIMGATWDPGAALNGSQQASIVNLNLDTLNKTDKQGVSFRLPPTYGAGLAVKANRSTIAADVHFVDWRKAVNDQPLSQNYS